MASSSEIRAQILSVLQGVADIGKVYERERYAKNNKDLGQLYITDSVLAGGFIRRKSFRQQSADTVVHVVWTIWEIELFRGFSDDNESEIAFDSMIDEIDGAFRADQTLNGTVDGTVTDEQSGIQLVTQQPAMFAGVLIHYAKLRLITEHTES